MPSLLAAMAQTPSIYFEDLWLDAQMPDILIYLAGKTSHWTDEAAEIMAQMPWGRLQEESAVIVDGTPSY